MYQNLQSVWIMLGLFQGAVNSMYYPGMSRVLLKGKTVDAP